MEIIKNYDTFKEKCNDFAEKFEKQYMMDNQIICHPAVDNLIIAPCSAEESKSNALNICRMADMLLMSEDADDWQKFVIVDARKIAEQNGYVFLTDLCYESAFQSEDWMINGRNDTIVVSEEYMREKGKKYSPVTPLTNKVLRFKKMYNNFFWKQSKPWTLNVINKSVINQRLDEYSSEVIKLLPDIKYCDKAVFKLFKDEVEISRRIVLQNNIEKIFERIDLICEEMKKNTEIMSAVAFSFNIVDFISGMLVTYLQNMEIGITKDKFIKEYYLPVMAENTSVKFNRLSSRNERADVDGIKLAFIEVIEKESSFDFRYEIQNYDEFMQSLHTIETSGQDDYDIQFMICDLLRNKPLSPAVFNLILSNYPDQVENVEAIAGFWNMSDMSDYEIRDYIFNEYIIKKNMLDDCGEFAVELELARIAKNDLDIVTKKYNCPDTDCLQMINNYIDAIDKKQRTYNGTLFDNIDDMKKAMENELKLQELCYDLTALDKNELLDLQKYIIGLSIDRANTAKYLVKIKIALNRCEQSQLEMLCTGLLFKSLDEVTSLKEKAAEMGYDEAVAKPFMISINDRILSAQRDELTALFADIGNKKSAELYKLLEVLNSGRYSSMFVKYYSNRIILANDSIARSELEELCNDCSSLDRDDLVKLKAKINEKSFRPQIKNRYLSKIDVLLSEFDKNEVAEIFAGIDSADRNSIEALNKIVESEKYSSMLLAPYITKIAARERVLIQEEFDQLCSNISTMDNAELETLKKTVLSGKYDDSLTAKCSEAIHIREYELIKSEIDNLCRDTASMSQTELDNLKNALYNSKYNDVLTAPYFDKISERESELFSIELDEKCSKISEMTREQLFALREEIYNKQDFIYLSKPYFEKIDNRLEEIKKADQEKMITDIDSLTPLQLDAFIVDIGERREELGEELYARCVDSIDKRTDSIQIEELNGICSGCEAFDMQKARTVENIILDRHYKATNSQPFIEKLNSRILSLYTEQLERITEDAETKSKEALTAIQEQIKEFDRECPAEIKNPFMDMISEQIKALADAKLKEVCGNIDSLTAKQSFDLIRKIDLMSIEEQRKDEYIDLIDAHILKMKNKECNLYLGQIIKKMAEYGITSVHFHVPTISKVFNSKYDSVCKSYVSSGRYELPLLLHESTVGSSDEGFVLTTEFLYFKTKQGAFNRIKIEDISSFQAKKSLVSSTLQVIEKNGTTYDLPSSFNKSIIDNAAKILSSLVSFIHDERATARMQEIIDQKSDDIEIKIPDSVTVDIVNNKTAEEEEEVPVAACAAEMWTLESEVLTDTDDNADYEDEDVEKDAIKTEEEIDDIDSCETPEEEPVMTDNTSAEEISDITESNDEMDALDNNDAEESEAPSERKRIKFCEQCGAKITSNTAKFCAECGHKIL